jgi:NADPH-dependent glutamate synthase beta subunit-like oxidoreductase
MGSLEKDASASSASGHKTRILPIGRSAKEYYEPFPPNHFAPKAGHQKLDIAIIGAGIAGLTAAVALLQSGHNVEVRRGLSC